MWYNINKIWNKSNNKMSKNIEIIKQKKDNI